MKAPSVGCNDLACSAAFTVPCSFTRSCTVALVSCLICLACPLTPAPAALPAGPCCCGPGGAGTPPELASCAAGSALCPPKGCASAGGMLCALGCKGSGKLEGSTAAPICCPAGVACSRSDWDVGAGSCVAGCTVLGWACAVLTCPLPAGSTPPFCSFPGSVAHSGHVGYRSCHSIGMRALELLSIEKDV